MKKNEISRMISIFEYMATSLKVSAVHTQEIDKNMKCISNTLLRIEDELERIGEELDRIAHKGE